MKLFKAMFIVFSLSFILSTGAVMAYEVHTFIGITLGGSKGIYTSPVSKSKIGDRTQRMMTDGATDLLTGKDRAVEVRVGGLVLSTYEYGSKWAPAEKSLLVDIPNSSEEGPYKLQIRATTSTLAKVNYSGRWYYQL